MRYPLYDMNCDDFENLVILICNQILGSGVIPFAKGKDGGKDGRFTGRANKIPSEAKPWEGKIIIQAKHTTKIDAKCSGSDFKRILKDEVIPAIKLLKAKKEIDFYILFTNRSLSGIQDSEITKLIYDETEIQNIIVADEKIQMYLQEYPEVVKIAQLNRLLLPMEFDDSDLREVIIFLHEQIKDNASVCAGIEFNYPGLEMKNELNRLGKNYFDNVVKKSMGDFYRIRKFLSDSINQDIEEVYADAVSELNAKIELNREQFYEFEQLLETCYDNFVRDNADTLKGRKKLVRTLLHYMYCNCDIGIKE